MGNTLGRKKSTKIMKIDGETIKMETPVKAGEILKKYPGLVLLESEAVKHYGIRAKPLEAHQELQPKRLYFLVEFPKETMPPRRVRSGINMSAKERLESLVLSRKSTSDLTIMKLTSMAKEESSQNGGVRLKLRLPKAEVEKLIKGSKNEAEAGERIMSLCMENNNRSSNKHEIEEIDEKRVVLDQHMRWKVGRSRVGESTMAREKRASIMAINELKNPLLAVTS